MTLWWVPGELEVPGWLSPDEIAEAQSRPEGVVLEGWRRTRRAVRAVLSAALGVDPVEICYERSAAGKPRLVGAELEFSVSHSGSEIVIAVGREEVGVDVETFGRERMCLEIAERYFPRAEARWLAARPKELVSKSFLRLWVSKEAALKCLGTGLAGYIERTLCEHDKDGRVSAVRVDGRTFRIREFDLGNVGIGAVATEGTEPKVNLLRAEF